MIEKEDILKVGASIGITDLTDTEINQILEEYESYQRSDPSGTWNLVIEEQIQEIISNR